MAVTGTDQRVLFQVCSKQMGNWFFGRVGPLASFIEFLLCSDSTQHIGTLLSRFVSFSTSQETDANVLSL
jgi:hypothetical protein